MSLLSRLLFGSLDKPLHRFDPRLLLYRIRHRLFGPWMGCSCSKCYQNPRRIPRGQEIVDLNVRVANLEAELRQLKRRARGD